MRPVCQTPLSKLTPPTRPTPENACDCHAHMYGGAGAYPHAADRPFDPAPGDFEHYLAEYCRLHRALGLSRGVLVHSNVYGTDNSVTLDALRVLGDGYKGIALVGPDASTQELQTLKSGGMCGIRLNLIGPAGFELEDLEALAPRLADLDFHAEVIMFSPDTLLEVGERLTALPIPVVFDHACRFTVSAGLDDPGFQRLVGLLGEGKCWVKLSGIYRLTADLPRMVDAEPFVRELMAVNPERVVWGSDWPHVQYEGVMPNDGDLLNFLGACVSEDDAYARILADNPQKLYRFTDQ